MTSEIRYYLVTTNVKGNSKQFNATFDYFKRQVQEIPDVMMESVEEDGITEIDVAIVTYHPEKETIKISKGGGFSPKIGLPLTDKNGLDIKW